MKLLNHVYYCIYRYIRRTPDRQAADAWPSVFLGLTLFLHGMFTYEFLALITTGRLWPIPRKLICAAGMVFLMLLFYWHYDWKKNGVHVIRSFEKRGKDGRYARMGAIIWYEGLLFPFIVVGLLILSQKLTGWPPSP